MTIHTIECHEKQIQERRQIELVTIITCLYNTWKIQKNIYLLRKVKTYYSEYIRISVRKQNLKTNVSKKSIEALLLKELWRNR